MRMMNPSVMVSRLDLLVLELAAAGIVFPRLPSGFGIFGVFLEQGGGAGGHLIRLQRIYNFLLFHAVILSFLDGLQSFYSNFISFLGLTY